MMGSSATTDAVLDYESPEPKPIAAMSLQRYMTLVGWGLLVTTLGQTASIGYYPIRFLLKDKLGATPLMMAGFVAFTSLPWSFKPIAGLLSDGLPLFGSRRRWYLILSTGCAGLLWFAMGGVTSNYKALLWVTFLMNVMAALASTVNGGLLVEGAQKHGATGRLSSLRLVIINITSIVGLPVGGYLATKWFGWTALSAGLLFLSMVPVTLLLLREPRIAKTVGDASAFGNAWQQLVKVFKSPALWIAGGLFFLVQVAPGLYTPLLYYQTNTLKLKSQFIGNLGIIYGGMGLLASFVYPFVCGRFRLRTLLYFAITCTVLSNLSYLGYVSWKMALVIEGLAGMGLTLAQLPLFDLAARATPRGSEALGYSLMIALWNIGLSLSDIIGSALFEKYNLTFMNLVWVNAGTTALVLVVIPFLPRRIVDRKEGESTAEVQVPSVTPAPRTCPWAGCEAMNPGNATCCTRCGRLLNV
jgi:MFS family permease